MPSMPENEPSIRVRGPTTLRKHLDELHLVLEVNGTLVAVTVTIAALHASGTKARRAREAMRAEIQSHLESLA
jgi:hypothetical protein